MALPNIETIVDDMGFLDDWEDRYRYIIELGRMLPPFPEVARTEANKVRGCASQVWLDTHIDNASSADPRLVYLGDSDAHIVRGLVAMAIALYSGKKAKEIVATDAIEFFGNLGLKEHLSAQRSNGFRSLIDRIRHDAVASLSRPAG